MHHAKSMGTATFRNRDEQLTSTFVLPWRINFDAQRELGDAEILNLPQLVPIIVLHSYSYLYHFCELPVSIRTSCFKVQRDSMRKVWLHRISVSRGSPLLYRTTYLFSCRGCTQPAQANSYRAASSPSGRFDYLLLNQSFVKQMATTEKVIKC